MVVSQQKWELDTQAYLNVCNITAELPRQQIRDFSKRVNDLGLWNSMVCWPLRSSQNAGVGTTAYSLGGLGTFNGRLVNGPTWGANALDFTTDNSRMDTDVVLSVAPAALMVVHQPQLPQEANNVVYLTAGINVSGRQFTGGNTGATTAINLNGFYGPWPPSALAFNVQINNSIGTRTDRDYNSIRILSSSTARCSRNATQSGSDVAVTGWDTSSPAFTRYGYYPMPGANDTLSFMAHFTAAIDNTTDAAFYTLYKQTLGQGLGLP
jgi:hypothetical protein